MATDLEHPGMNDDQPAAGLPELRMLPGRHKRLRDGHPWAFSNEIAMDAATALPVTPASNSRFVPSGKIRSIMVQSSWFAPGFSPFCAGAAAGHIPHRPRDGNDTDVSR